MTTTHHEYRNFVFAIDYQAKQPAYTVKFPDFPAIITSGDDLKNIAGFLNGRMSYSAGDVLDYLLTSAATPAPVYVTAPG